MTTIKIQIGEWQRDYVLAVTDAPKEYDGFGTFTLRQYTYPLNVGKVFTKHPARFVAVPVEHLGWIEGRYSSGLYCFWVNEIAEEFPEIIKATTDILLKRFMQITED